MGHRFELATDRYLEHHSNVEVSFWNCVDTGETFGCSGQNDAQHHSDDALEPGDEQRCVQTKSVQLAAQKNLIDEHQQNGDGP